MYLSSLIISSALILSTNASPLSNNVDRGRPTTLSLRSTAQASPILGETITTRIALAQQNIDQGEDCLLNNVANPASPTYGQYWTFQKVLNTFKPSDEAVDAIKTWLKSQGVRDDQIKTSAAQYWLEYSIPAQKHKDMFERHNPGQNYSMYAKYCYLWPASTLVPEDLEKHIDFFVLGGASKMHQASEMHCSVKRHLLRREYPNNDRGTDIDHRDSRIEDWEINVNQLSPKDLSSFSSSCYTDMTPKCLQTLYRFLPNTANNPDNSYGVFKYRIWNYWPADLLKFFDIFSPFQVHKQPIHDDINSFEIEQHTPNISCIEEPDLDFEYAMTLVNPQQINLYEPQDCSLEVAVDENYCTLRALTDGTCQPLKAISISYVSDEASLFEKHRSRLCTEFMKLGLMGTTVLVASGDRGTAGLKDQCKSSEFENPTAPEANYTKLKPNFPSTCPYVTSVGATQLRDDISLAEFVQYNTQPEVAAHIVIPLGGSFSEIFSSGGGFSKIFSLPSYQNYVVNEWLNNYTAYEPSQFKFLGISRGYPDVSANGVNYSTIINGSKVPMYGTSASAPTFGSIINIINGRRLAAGKTSVGFINPTLYAHPEIFTDVTEGNNSFHDCPGFSAAPG